MQINQTKAKMRVGQSTFGAFVGLAAPNVVEHLASASLDLAVTDCEHGTVNPEREGLPPQVYTSFSLASAGESVGERGGTVRE